MRRMLFAAAALLVLPALAACSDSATSEIHAIGSDGVGETIGAVRLSDGEGGLVLEVTVSGLPPGPHGFHVHENASCGAAEKGGVMVAGLAAGGHYDPENTGRHEGPNGTGHLGDLPVLLVEAGPDGASGIATVTLVAPRLTVADVRGRALIIHENGDNYSDTPEPLGGGGARIACGVVE